MARPHLKITSELIKRAEALAAQGLTNEEIAHNLGVSPSCLYAQKAKNKELMEAITRGKAKGIAVIANKCFELAKAGNMRAIEFFLERRGGWRRPKDDYTETPTEPTVKII